MSSKVILPSNTKNYGAGKSVAEGTKLYHIEGLRGVAIGLVVFFHVFIGRVSSGVDIFLFIGGIFLLNTHLSNFVRTQRISYPQAVSRMLRRLYPELIVVIACGILLELSTRNLTELQQVIHDGFYSAIYAINIDLWRQGSEYVGIGEEPSTYQHLWSMSVQMQIYITVITVIAFIGWLKRKKIFKTIVSIYIILVIVSIGTIASFFYACHVHSYDQVLNYYSPLTRFWEIGLGMLFGYFLLHRIVLRPITRWILSIVGFSMVLSSGFIFNGSELYPGPWVLYPLLGAIFVICSGLLHPVEDANLRSMGPAWILTTKPFVWLGSISYSLYLWHWVILVYLTRLDFANSIVTGIVTISISLVLAAWSKKIIGDTLSQKKKPQYANFFEMIHPVHVAQSIQKAQPLQVGATIVVLCLTAGVLSAPSAYSAYSQDRKEKAQAMVAEEIQQKEAESEESSSDQPEQEHTNENNNIEKKPEPVNPYPGAGAFLYGETFNDQLPIIPDPTEDIKVTMPIDTPDGCFSGFDGSDLKLTKKDGSPCIYGDKDAEDTLIMVGGSHSEQYITALDTIAKQRNFKIIPLFKMGCALYQPERVNKPEGYPECIDWSDKVMDYIYENPPSLGVFMTGTRPKSILGHGPEIVPDYYREVVRRLNDKNIHVWLLRDNPWGLDGNTPEAKQRNFRKCIPENEKNYIGSCGQPWNWNMASVDPQIEGYKGLDNTTLMDLSAAYTKDGFVHPVVGGVVVFRDSHHLTKQFVSTMTRALDEAMFGDNPRPEVFKEIDPDQE